MAAPSRPSRPSRPCRPDKQTDRQTFVVSFKFLNQNENKEAGGRKNVRLAATAAATTVAAAGPYLAGRRKWPPRVPIGARVHLAGSLGARMDRVARHGDRSKVGVCVFVWDGQRWPSIFQINLPLVAILGGIYIYMFVLIPTTAATVSQAKLRPATANNDNKR